MNVDLVKKIINDHVSIFNAFNDDFIKSIYNYAEIIHTSFDRGGKLYIFGNGGSASDAQHIAAEFSGRFLKERKALPAISLNTDTSAITAIANDYGYENIFSRQLDGLLNLNDIVLALSTSGNSLNIINALELSNTKNIVSLSLTGKNGGKVKLLSSFNINIESDSTARIQEAHIFIGHLICKIIDEKY